jgi:hypothetical protein
MGQHGYYSNVNPFTRLDMNTSVYCRIS